MKKTAQLLRHLPELPTELFELSGELIYSEAAPVITHRANKIIAEPTTVAVAIPKPDFTIKTWFGWVIYPNVVCYPFPDTHAVEMKLESSKPLLNHEADLAVIASHRRYYRLSRIGNEALVGWGCVVHYGPYAAKATETESCDGTPNQWELESFEPPIFLQWYGTWEDRPSLPNLTVVMDVNGPTASVTTQCCGGYSYCPSTMSCIPSHIRCLEKQL